MCIGFSFQIFILLRIKNEFTLVRNCYGLHESFSIIWGIKEIARFFPKKKKTFIHHFCNDFFLDNIYLFAKLF